MSDSDSDDDFGPMPVASSDAQPEDLMQSTKQARKKQRTLEFEQVRVTPPSSRAILTASYSSSFPVILNDL